MNKKKIILKYIIVGDTGVGKTSIVNLFANGFYEFTHKPTIGVSMMQYNFELENEKINVQFWDTAGQERYDSMSKNYYRNSICVFFVFDITNRNSFLSLDKWIENVDSGIYTKYHIIFFGNKSDMKSERKVLFTEAEEFAKKHNGEYYETSCNNKENIKNIILSSFEISYKLQKEYYDLLAPKTIKFEENTHFYSSFSKYFVCWNS